MDSLRITLNISEHAVIYHLYASPQNWTSTEFLSFYWYGANTSKVIAIIFHTDPWKDYYQYNLFDNFTGWKKMLIPKNDFASVGNPSWSSISGIEITFTKLIGQGKIIFYLDKMVMHGVSYGLTSIIPPLTTFESEDALIVLKYNLSSSQTIEGILRITTSDRARLWEYRFVGSGEWQTLKVKLPSNVFSQETIVSILVLAPETEEPLFLKYFGVLDVMS